MTEQRGSGLFAGVFLVSASVLAHQVALTRLFSVMLRYHFVFLVTSIAICGLGVGGLLAHALRPASGRQMRGVAATAAVVCGLTMAGTTILLLRCLLVRAPDAYVAIGLLLLIPFTAAGVFMSLAFRELAEVGGRLYGADLSGAATASLVVILLLEWVGGVNACLLTGSLAAAAGLTVGWARARTAALAGAIALGACAMAAASNVRSHWLETPPLRSHNMTLTKPLFRDLAAHPGETTIEFTDWSAFARTDVAQDKGVEYKHIYTDGEVPTQMFPFDGDLNSMRWLTGELSFFPYLFTPRQRVLSIGPGGGMDVLLAMLAGVPQVDGVEINPAINRVMRHYADFNGRLYDYQGVDVRIGEGRSFVRTHASRRYDLIALALTQTATTGSVGMSLAESYIHTREAFADYYHALTPHGAVSMITQEWRLALRMFLTAVEMLGRTEKLPPIEAARHVYVVRVSEEAMKYTPYRYLFVLQRDAVSPRQAERIVQIAGRLNFHPLFVPGAAEEEPYSRLASGEWTSDDFALACARDGFNVRPVTDDAPFFLDLSLHFPASMWGLLLGSLGFLLLLNVNVALPPADRRAGAGTLLLFVVYFALLGAGFMLVEIALAQELVLVLGYPTLTLSVTLFALLLGGAAGGWWSQRLVHIETAGGAAWAGLRASVAVTVAPLLLGQLEPWLLRTDIFPRCLTVMAVLFALGLWLGMPFPTGVRLLRTCSPNDVPWMWGVNGIASVTGSTAAVMGAKVFGFSVVLAAGAAAYVLVTLVALALGRARLPRTASCGEADA